MPEILTDAQKVLRNDTGLRMAAALEVIASRVEPSTVIAPEYDAEQTYAVGDLVIYRNALYRCTTAIPTPEEWTTAHWTATMVSDEYRPAAAQDLIDGAQDAEITTALHNFRYVGDTPYYSIPLADIESGDFNSSGTNATSTTRLRTKGYYTCNPDDVLTFSVLPSTLLISVAFFRYADNSENNLCISTFKAGSVAASVPPAARYFRVKFCKANDAAIAVSDIESVTIQCKAMTERLTNTEAQSGFVTDIAGVFAFGGVNASGKDTDSANRMKTWIFFPTWDNSPVRVVWTASADLKCSLQYYAASDFTTRIGSSGWFRNGEVKLCPSGARYFRVMFAREDNADLTLAELSTCKLFCGGALAAETAKADGASAPYSGELTQALMHSYSGNSMTVINGRLYFVPYVETSAPGVTTAEGEIFDIGVDGKLTDSGDTFTVNTGHVNSIDYSPYNDCVVIGNGGNSNSTEPNKIYIFAKASSRSSFLVSNADLVLDVHAEDWGKQLNCCWVNSRYRTDILCCLTNYEAGNMDYYGQNNPNQITGESRSFIRLVQLGTGSNNLGSGTYQSGKADGEFNGTYKVLKTFERPGYTREKANNDLCWVSNALLEMHIQDSEYGFTFWKNTVNEYGEIVSEKIVVPFSSLLGNPLVKEPEGICWYNGYLYLGTRTTYIGVVKYDGQSSGGAGADNILSNLAYVEPGAAAAHHYAIGDMLVFSGRLCKATRTIAAGDTLTVGTGGNLESTRIETELDSKVSFLLSELHANEPWYEGVDLTQKFASEISGDAWAWIKARIQAGSFEGIHQNDYIPFTANSTAFKACAAGINTYKGCGDDGHVIGNHIDFICRELWPTNHVFNKKNYNNGVPAFTPEGGTAIAAQEYPWLASDLYHYINSLAGYVPDATTLNPTMTAVDYTQGGIYYYLPAALKAVIVKKRAYIPKRFSASGLVYDDNAGGWADIGKLWLPSEIEVYGVPCWGGKGGYSTMGFVQYPLFAYNMNRTKNKGSSRSWWWLLSTCTGNTTNFCGIGNGGGGNSGVATSTHIAAPICFRIA